MRFLIAVAAAMLATSAWAGERVTYQVDGTDYEGYFAGAGEGAKGLVLIVHDWDGMTDYEVKRADMLAELGYDAFALDLFGKGNLPKSIKENQAKTGALYQDRGKMRALMAGGLAAAQAQSDSNTVVMGYCFGGAAVLELARSGLAKGVVGYATFHGGLATPQGQSYPDDTPPMLIAHGGADQFIPMDDVVALSKQFEEKGISYEIEIYSGAPHAFTVFGANSYRKTADRKSWEAFQEFLGATLSG
jgi:dienelactone hydrolase